MNLLQDFVDIDSIRFLPSELLFLFVTLVDGFCSLSRLFHGFSRDFWRHGERISVSLQLLKMVQARR